MKSKPKGLLKRFDERNEEKSKIKVIRGVQEDE